MENRFPGLGKYQKIIHNVRHLKKEVGKFLGICITICSLRKAQKTSFIPKGRFEQAAVPRAAAHPERGQHPARSAGLPASARVCLAEDSQPGFHLPGLPFGFQGASPPFYANSFHGKSSLSNTHGNKTNPRTALREATHSPPATGEGWRGNSHRQPRIKRGRGKHQNS